MTLTPTTVAIALLGVLAGYIVQAINTGSLFGVVTVPKPWLPYLALVATFLSAFVTSIASVPADGAAWFNALLAGLLALGGNATGVTIHQHTHAANDNGDATVPGAKKAA